MLRFLLPGALIATPALADSEGYGHMMYGGHGHGFGMLFGPVLWLLVLGLIVAGIIWLVRRMDHDSAARGPDDARALLDLRLAKGEIDAEEYVAKKRLLSD